MAIRPCLSTLAVATIQRHGGVPLLNSQRLVFWQIKSYLLALRVEGIQVNVYDNTERAVSGRLSEICQMFVSESRLPSTSTAACRHRRGRLEGLRGRHGFLRGVRTLRLSINAIFFEREARGQQVNRGHHLKPSAISLGHKYSDIRG